MIDLSSLSADCLGALLDVSVKAPALAALAGLGLGACRVRSPAVRHAAWAAVLGGMLGLPLPRPAMPGIVVPLWPGSVGRAAGAEATSRGELGPGLAVAALPAGAAAGPEAEGLIRTAGIPEHPAGAARRAPGARVTWSVIVFGGYLAGVVVMLGRYLLGLAGCRRLVRAGRAIGSERLAEGCSPWLGRALLRHPVEVRVCPCVRVPLTFGWWRPRILLPGDWTAWGPSKREAVLAHELAHLERRDALFLALGTFNRCLY
jgi:hypothetical protein